MYGEFVSFSRWTLLCGFGWLSINDSFLSSFVFRWRSRMCGCAVVQVDCRGNVITEWLFVSVVSSVYLLIAYNTVLLVKLTVLQLVKKFSAFCRTRGFITAFTSARHLSPSHLKIHHIIILPSLSPPSCLFFTGLPPNPCIHLCSPTYVLHAPPFSFFSIWSPE
jgi:hypothetical protein